MSKGFELISVERKRQIEVEGWTAAHDDGHGPHMLEMAAQSYRDATNHGSTAPSEWPWDKKWWKPGARLRNLARAGALYLAAADAAERAGENDLRNRLRDQADSCAVLLDSIL